jgi:predicted nicotinamide N-methyase
VIVDIPSSLLLPETPWDALGPLVREPVIIEGRSFLIERPAASDQLLDHPYVQAAFARDEYMPYWADLWPSARMLAKVVAREPWPKNLDILEVGCGLGLPGIVALARGHRVIFSDYDGTAVRMAAGNARLNGFDNFQTLHLDWRQPPAYLRSGIILAADLIYENRNVETLVAFVRQVLLPGGFCLLTDQDRIPAHLLPEALVAAGLEYTTRIVRAGEPGGRRIKGTLYRITHVGASSLLL